MHTHIHARTHKYNYKNNPSKLNALHNQLETFAFQNDLKGVEHKWKKNQLNES